MATLSAIETISRTNTEDSAEQSRQPLLVEPGFLVKIHPFELHSALIRLEKSRFVIGRDPQNDLQVQDGSASRFHAVIERRGETYEITDLNSTNGLFINQLRVSKAQLQTGDRIRLGDHIYKYLSAGHIEAEYHETVYSMMTRDGLTGAFNKRYFADALTREIDRAERSHHILSLAFFDIDHFKKINDTFGHLAGDQVLQEFTQRIVGAAPKDAVMARLGGEEFALLFSECDLDEAKKICELARLAISERPFLTSAGPIPVTVSIGLCALKAGPITATEFAKAADDLLYESKANGRNRTTSRDLHGNSK